MTKTILSLIAVILGAFVGLSSPALAGKGGGGGGQNASSTSSHASTGSQSGNQTQTKQQSNVRKSGGSSTTSGQPYLQYKFDTIYTH
jgi:hypothetical protein